MPLRFRGSPVWPALVAMLALLSPAAGASALGLNAELGFGGYAVPGRWVPLWISGERAMPAGTRVEVQRTGAEGRVLGLESFPLQEDGRIECPVWVEGGLEAITVRLSSSSGVLAEAKLDTRARLFPGNLVLACGLPLPSRLAISSSLLPGESVHTVALDQADLPANGLDYDGVSAVAIEDRGIVLSPAQRTALLAWMSGGGWMLVSSAGLDNSSLTATLLGPGAGKGAAADPGAGGAVAIRHGLGGLVRITRELAGLPLSREAAFWRSSLRLAPYGSSPRLSASSVSLEAQAELRLDEAARKANFALLVALCLWIAASLATALLGRGRVWPAAALAAVSLALVFAGAPSLERALRQGSSTRVLALVLPTTGPASGPETGSVFVAAGLMRRGVQAPFEWTQLRALRALPLAYGTQEWLGSAAATRRGPAPWEHGLPLASFSPRDTGGEELEFQALLGQGALAGSGLPDRRLGPNLKSTQTPELDSNGPLLLAAAGEGGALWEKSPEKTWLRLEKPPLWMEGELDWLRELRTRAPALSFLAGRGEAPSLGLRVGGSPPASIFWVLPVEEDLAGAGGQR